MVKELSKQSLIKKYKELHKEYLRLLGFMLFIIGLIGGLISSIATAEYVETVSISPWLEVTCAFGSMIVPALGIALLLCLVYLVYQPHDMKYIKSELIVKHGYNPDKSNN
jgi:uncharacterized membrane protein YhdT